MSFLERGDKENDSIFRLHEQGNCENWSRLRLRRWWGVMQPVLDVRWTICIAFAFLADCPLSDDHQMFQHSWQNVPTVCFLLSHLHPAARQFCRSTYTITDITIK
jgi:hypothetical protein